MKIVIDTSAIIAVIANEPEKAALIRQTQGADLFAPVSLHAEIGSAFSAMLKRQRINLEQVKTAIEIYRQIEMNLLEIELTQAIELASERNIYAYDAYVLACAINENCLLLSLDSGLIRAAKSIGIEVLEVEDDANLS